MYFMCEFLTDKKQLEIAAMTPREKLMCYWGHRFERYVLSSAGSTSGSAVNLNEKYYSIVSTKLDNHQLMFGGEVDCIDPQTGEYLELKTNRQIEAPKHVDSFLKFKIVKWWLQSFLIGIKTIICGFRTDQGIVTALDRVCVKDLASHAKQYWSGATCFKFLSQFLSVVKAKVHSNDANAVFKFEYDPENQKILFRRDNNAEHIFLPNWFIGEFVTK